MRPTTLRIDHLAFPSFDAAETYRFYTEVMGFRFTFAFNGESKEWGDKRYLITGFSCGSLHIDFFDLDGVQRPQDEGLPKDIRHVALSVESLDQIEEWKTRLAAHGVAYWVEHHDGVPSVYFSDPNDVMFEITCHPEKQFDERLAAQGLEVVRRWTAARKQHGSL